MIDHSIGNFVDSCGLASIFLGRQVFSIENIRTQGFKFMVKLWDQKILISLATSSGFTHIVLLQKSSLNPILHIGP